MHATTQDTVSAHHHHHHIIIILYIIYGLDTHLPQPLNHGNSI